MSSNNMMEENINAYLSEDNIQKIMKEYFKIPNVLFDHHISSYNAFIKKIVNYFQNNIGRFEEIRVENNIYTNYFKYENVIVRPMFEQYDNVDKLLVDDKSKNKYDTLTNKILLYPQDARLSNLTYSIKLIATVIQYQEIYNLDEKKIVSSKEISRSNSEEILIVPNMVKSVACATILHKKMNNGECKMDPGGYFIVKGKEKILLSMERIVDNKPLVFIKKEGISSNVYNIYQVQINSKSQDPNVIMQQIVIRIKKNNLTIKVPIFQEVSVFVVLRALGLETDREIINFIVENMEDTQMINILILSLKLSKTEGTKIILTKEDAINYLITKVNVRSKYPSQDKKTQYEEKKEHLKMLFENSFLPHIDNKKYNDVLRVKAYYLCYMINKLLKCFLGRTDPDDRDSFVNKRVDLAGDLIFESVMRGYKKMLNDCNKIFNKKTQGNPNNPQNIINQMKIQTIEQDTKSMLSKGESGKKAGLSQPLPRYTYYQTVESLRRLDPQPTSSSTEKLTGPRHYHPSQVGFIDGIESPEHANIGLTKHLSIIGSITIAQPDQTEIIYDIIKSNPLFMHINNISVLDLLMNIKIFINGEWIGITNDGNKFYKELRDLKNNNIISKKVGIVYDIQKSEIKIYTDSGRLYRPILNVENNEVLLNNKIIDEIMNDKSDKNINKFNLLMSKYPKTISYIDSEEQYYSLIAEKFEDVFKQKMTDKEVYEDSTKPIINRYRDGLIQRYTYCEINPCLLTGMIASSIPFLNYNTNTRNIYQFAQGKQAMSIYATNYRDRIDISYILYNAQRPLVNTIISKYIRSDILPCGENIIAMMGCYTGMNQDDSLIFNQSSIDRGLFRSMSFYEYKDNIQKNQSTAEDNKFGRPEQSIIKNDIYDYTKLNDKGYVPEETVIKNGDIIIGKYTPIQGMTSQIENSDASTPYKNTEPAIIDKVYPNLKLDGYPMIKIKTRSEKIPRIGDKFCFIAENTDVLTIDGWKNIGLVSLNDQVAILDTNDRILFEKPSGVYKFNYEGKIYSIRNDQIDIDVTMDHKMYIRYENKDIFELLETTILNNNSKNYHLKKNGIIPDVQSIKKLMLDGYNADYDNYLRILGLFLFYGYIGDENIIHINNNPIVIENLKNLTKKLNIKLVDNSTFKIYSFKNRSLYALFSSIDKDVKLRRFPDYVLKLNILQSEVMLNALDIDNDNIIKTFSRLMCDDIMILAIRAGYSATFNFEDNIYKVKINKDNNEPLIQKHETYEQDFKGIVACLEVRTNVFMVRQNNKNVWSGNCSRYGQKGTIGLTLHESDMPFTSQGIYPDLILNPNAIPGRMTVSHMIEKFVGKIAAIKGIEADGTGFTKMNFEYYEKELESLGYKKDGTEYMTSGITGRKMNNPIYIGPIFYQRLKHMASDKIHARSKGMTTLLTRQPSEGRSKDGGFRIGEMERDAIVSHGLSLFLKERLLDSSDLYQTYVCDVCGLFAQRMKRIGNLPYPQATDIYECIPCKNKTRISKVVLPYACKLFFQELLSMNIAPRIKTKQY